MCGEAFALPTSFFFVLFSFLFRGEYSMKLLLGIVTLCMCFFFFFFFFFFFVMFV